MLDVIKIKNLSITLGGNVKALKNISLDIPEGKITGFIGPSGAGKTTLMKAIVGRLKITPGSLTILDLPAGSAELRNEVNYMTQELSVYADLTVKENLMYFGLMKGLTRKEAKQITKELLARLEISDKENTLVSELSGGQKQRVSLAVALLGSPKLLVLDEPTIGLDPSLRNRLWK